MTVAFDEVVDNIPIYGSPKAIKDVLEKFDVSLVPLYIKMAPNCWEHNHIDGVFINCRMDSQNSFKVLGLTKMDLKSFYAK